mgnify:CR=1 FL=1
MIRTQVQLSEAQVRRLREYAARQGISLAEAIRQAVETLPMGAPGASIEDRRARALAAAGRFHSGRKDLSSRHDEHLAEAYSR